jgi:hypothetical protein
MGKTTIGLLSVLAMHDQSLSISAERRSRKAPKKGRPKPPSLPL